MNFSNLEAAIEKAQGKPIFVSLGNSPELNPYRVQYEQKFRGSWIRFLTYQEPEEEEDDELGLFTPLPIGQDAIFFGNCGIVEDLTEMSIRLKGWGFHLEEPGPDPERDQSFHPSLIQRVREVREVSQEDKALWRLCHGTACNGHKPGPEIFRSEEYFLPPVCIFPDQDPQGRSNEPVWSVTTANLPSYIFLSTSNQVWINRFLISVGYPKVYVVGLWQQASALLCQNSPCGPRNWFPTT